MNDFFYYVLLLIIQSALNRKKDKSEPAKLSDFNVPTATEDRALSRGFGTFAFSPNVIWHGDLNASKIYKKQKTGFFTSSETAIGFNYQLGLWFAGLGQNATYLKQIIWDNDKLIYNPTTALQLRPDTDNPVKVKYTYRNDGSEDLYEGVEGTFHIHNVRADYDYALTRLLGTQGLSDPYLQKQLNETALPLYRGNTHIVFEGTTDYSRKVRDSYLYRIKQTAAYNTSKEAGNSEETALNAGWASIVNSGTLYEDNRAGRMGWIGTTTSLPDIKFVFQYFCEDYLDYTALGTTYSNMVSCMNVNDGDANPAYVLLALFLSSSSNTPVPTPRNKIDFPSFQAAAQICKNEGLGFSQLYEYDTPDKTIMEDLYKLMDCVVYEDYITGKIKLKLKRFYTDLSSAVEFNADNIIEISSYEDLRADAPINTLEMSFVDRKNKFVNRVPKIFDKSLMASQGYESILRPEIKGISCEETAKAVATRELKKASQQTLKRANLKVNWDITSRPLYVGDLFKFNFDDEVAYFYITNIKDFANAEEPDVIDLEGYEATVQDISYSDKGFSMSASVYAYTPNTTHVQSTEGYLDIIMLPNQFNTAGIDSRMFVYCQPANRLFLDFKAKFKPSNPTNGVTPYADYVETEEFLDMAFRAKINSFNSINTDLTVEFDNKEQLDFYLNTLWYSNNNKAYLKYDSFFTGSDNGTVQKIEWLKIKSLTRPSDTTLIITVDRGYLGTMPMRKTQTTGQYYVVFVPNSAFTKNIVPASILSHQAVATKLPNTSSPYSSLSQNDLNTGFNRLDIYVSKAHLKETGQIVSSNLVLNDSVRIYNFTENQMLKTNIEDEANEGGVLTISQINRPKLNGVKLITKEEYLDGKTPNVVDCSGGVYNLQVGFRSDITETNTEFETETYNQSAGKYFVADFGLSSYDVPQVSPFGDNAISYTVVGGARPPYATPEYAEVTIAIAQAPGIDIYNSLFPYAPDAAGGVTSSANKYCKIPKDQYVTYVYLVI